MKAFIQIFVIAIQIIAIFLICNFLIVRLFRYGGYFLCFICKDLSRYLFVRGFWLDLWTGCCINIIFGRVRIIIFCIFLEFIRFFSIFIIVFIGGCICEHRTFIHPMIFFISIGITLQHSQENNYHPYLPQPLYYFLTPKLSTSNQQSQLIIIQFCAHILKLLLSKFYIILLSIKIIILFIFFIFLYFCYLIPIYELFYPFNLFAILGLLYNVTFMLFRI
jgi:hypothetical protein